MPMRSGPSRAKGSRFWQGNRRDYLHDRGPATDDIVHRLADHVRVGLPRPVTVCQHVREGGVGDVSHIDAILTLDVEKVPID